jgi:hypothetical protein
LISAGLMPTLLARLLPLLECFVDDLLGSKHCGTATFGVIQFHHPFPSGRRERPDNFELNASMLHLVLPGCGIYTAIGRLGPATAASRAFVAQAPCSLDMEVFAAHQSALRNSS